MAEKGLFNKVKNRPTRRRFVVSTIRKDENLFETAIFEANFFYLPRHWNQPDLTLESATPDEASDLHYKLTVRLTHEYPARLIQEYRESTSPPPPQD
jgi:DNA-binding MarR family transcriptional regulator